MNASDPRDWKADPISGELVIENGDIAIVFGLEAIRQDLCDRLALVRGEWFLAPEAGIPLFDSVLVKTPNLPLIGSIYRRAILGTEGVRSIQSFVLKFDRRARSASISFSADTDFGPLNGIEISPELPGDAVFDDLSFDLSLYE